MCFILSDLFSNDISFRGVIVTSTIGVRWHSTTKWPKLPHMKQWHAKDPQHNCYQKDLISVLIINHNSLFLSIFYWFSALAFRATINFPNCSITCITCNIAKTINPCLSLTTYNYQIFGHSLPCVSLTMCRQWSLYDIINKVIIEEDKKIG